MKKLLAALSVTTALAAPAMAQDIQEFNIGILGGENAQDRLNSNECMRAQVSDLLGVPVKLFAPADYEGVLQGLMGGTLDMALLGASGYAKIALEKPDAVDVALVTTHLDGSYVYYSIGIARKDSGITSLQDAKGKVFGFGDPNSTSGYLIPSVEIPGIIGEPMDKFFGEVKFTGGHEQTIVAVGHGDIAAGVTWADGQGAFEDGYNNGALRKASDAGLVNMNDLVQIWKSEPIPEGPVVLKHSLPQDVKDKVVKYLVDLKDTDKECLYGVAAGETAGFAPITADYYKSIIAVRKAKIGG